MTNKLTDEHMPEDNIDWLGVALCVLRVPGMAPQLKRPYGELGEYIRDLYRHNPRAEVTVVRIWADPVGCQSAQDGRELMAMEDDSKADQYFAVKEDYK